MKPRVLCVVIAVLFALVPVIQADQTDKESEKLFTGLQCRIKWIEPKDGPSYRSVSFGCHSHLKDVDLARLTKLDKVRSVKLISNEVTDEGMKQFATMKALRILNLNSSSITDKGIEIIAGSTKLEELTVMRCKLTSDSFAAMAKMKDLKKLSVTRVPIDDAALKELSKLKHVKMMRFSQMKPESLAVLDKLSAALPNTKILIYRR